MRIMALCLPVLLASAQGALAQTPTSPAAEESAVRAAHQHYIDGHATGEGAHHALVFHPVSNLYWVAGDTVTTRTSAAYIAGSPGRPAPDEAERRRRIAWVEVTGSTAVARIDLDYPTATFTDYMSLLRTGDEWRIVAKVFHVQRRGDPSPVTVGRNALAGPVAAPGTPTASDARSAIGAASRAFSDAYVSGDTAAIRELYTGDAVLLPPGTELRGGERIAAYFGPRPGRRNVAHAMTSAELRLAGDRAFDTGTWSHSWQAEGGPVQQSSGQYLVIWRLGADGRWRIEYDMWHRPTTR